ncbi:hypothetical protein A6B39_01135 [Mannheimia granulomatis]|nr:hypothetical protein A6B39_01135 [Mannheimia granulomatis]
MTISPCNSQNCPYIVKQRSTVGNLLTFLFLQAVIFYSLRSHFVPSAEPTFKRKRLCKNLPKINRLLTD